MLPQTSHRPPQHLRALPLVPLGILLFILAACGGAGDSSPEPKEDVTEETSQAPLPPADGAIEVEYWQSVKDSNDADQLLAYVKKYPEGQFIELAEARIKALMSNDPLDDPNVAGPGASNVDPPVTAPPPPQVSRRDRVLSVVRRSLGRYSDPRLHIAPNIPRFKADNAATVHGMDPRSILVLYDDGFKGGGKTGFAITDRRIYWRFVKGADALYLDFRDIQSAIARKNKFILNGYEVSTTMSSDTRYAAEVYSDLALDLRDAFR